MGRTTTPALTARLASLRHDADAIVAAAVAAVQPGALIDAWWDQSRHDTPRPVPVIAVGKAARGMFDAFARHVPIDVASSLVTATAPVTLRGVRRFASGHPLPNAESERAGRAALAIARQRAPGDLLVVLLSGGASAMLAVPAAPLTLDDKIELTRLMLAAGLPIEDINAVRTRLSAVKGGRLAHATTAASLTLAISDVVGRREDDPSVIGSGPTVIDTSTADHAVDVLTRAGLWAACPARVKRALSAGVVDEPGASSHLVASPARHQAHIIGSRRKAMDAARAEADRLHFTVIVDPVAVVGEARTAGRRLARRALDLGPGRWCLVSSGETTVRVVGRGKGGRNQELALAAAMDLATATEPIVLASVGTDGIDGPTDAAGAVVDPTTIARGEARGLRADSCLAENDTYRFFNQLDDLWRTGPTGTNVGDLQVVVAEISHD